MTTVRLFRTHLATHAGSLLVVGGLVLVMSALAAFVPRATSHVLTDAVRHDVRQLPAAQRDLTSLERGSPSSTGTDDDRHNTLPPASDRVWGGIDDALREARTAMPETMRSAFGPGGFAVTLPTAPASPLDPDVRTTANVILSLGFDPRLPSHVRITKGRAPRPVTTYDLSDSVVEIVLSDSVAETMGWPIGQRRTTTLAGLSTVVRLTGTYALKDAGDPLWSQVPAARTPSIEQPDGTKAIVTGVGWAEPGSWSSFEVMSDGAVVRTWFPLRPGAVTSANAAQLATQIREFTRQALMVPGEDYGVDRGGGRSVLGLTRLSFSSESMNVVNAAHSADASARATFALIASGPVGVAAVVLALAAGLVLRQQRRALDLVAARGASELELRGLMALEGMVIGLPTAMIGALVGQVLLPRDGSAAAWVGPALVGIAPAVLLAAMPPTARPERADLTPRGRTRWRWMLDLLVVLGAAAAVVALRSRGPARSGTGVDPLLACAPLLLSLAGCLAVMRAYPWILRRLLARVARGRRTTPLLGTARALRDPAAGLAAVLALVIGVAIAVFSGITTTTLRHGLDATATATVGADVVVTGRSLDPGLTTTLSARKDVRAVATISEQSEAPLYSRNRPVFGVLLVVDVAAVRRVQKDEPGALGLPRSLGRRGNGPVPVMVSEGYTRDRDSLRLGDAPLEVVGTLPAPGPLSDHSSYILVDRATAKDLGLQVEPPDRLLVDTVDSGSAVRAAVRRTGGKPSAETPDDVAERLSVSPLVPGVRHAAQLALGVLAALCVAVIGLSLLRGEASRSRQAALIGAMGEHRRRTRWLVAWEIGPLAIVSVVSGTALGLVLPAVVLGGVDLRVFTTGATQPPVVVDPLLTVLTVVGVLVVVAVGAAAAAMASRRQDLPRLLRMMED